MKKIIIIFITTMICTINVSAEEIYFENLNGATLTKEQYNTLIKEFRHDTLLIMEKELLNEIKHQKNLKVKKVEKYIQTDEYYDTLGNIVRREEKEIKKDLILNKEYIKDINSLNSVSHTTNMKILTLEIPEVNDKIVRVFLTNEWKSIPSVKSYDVIGIRPLSATNNCDIVILQSSAYQIWDGTNISYNLSSGDNKKYVKKCTGTSGLGVSMNIKNEVSKSLINKLSVGIMYDKPTYLIIEGTYQHATSTLSLSDSKSYTFHATGFGGVLKFNDSIISKKYDGMQGVTIQY